MKKTIIALATLGFAASSFAAVETADQTLQWSGAVPTYTASTDNWEVRAVGADLLNGELTFTADATGVNLTDATNLTFEVIKTADESQLAHTATLKSFEVMVDGALATETIKSQFSLVSRNGGTEAPMELNGTPTASGADKLTVLDVVAVENITGLVGGEEMAVKAILTVEADAAAI
ncbi:hypothetical protein HGP28_02760 [Vibrio sp. SM6]|uniref:YceI family protein n=1 Tax=Vibrio agarilyticus TaxID=2726741 RepID=A0A7X8TN51_9VIBR|nr:hypothetical protein [Vibrio agarilyticus]NLS11810.1 hypothetical protein [Vibrio agarilyticus]